MMRHVSSRPRLASDADLASRHTTSEVTETSDDNGYGRGYAPIEDRFHRDGHGIDAARGGLDSADDLLAYMDEIEAIAAAAEAEALAAAEVVASSSAKRKRLSQHCMTPPPSSLSDPLLFAAETPNATHHLDPPWVAQPLPSSSGHPGLLVDLAEEHLLCVASFLPLKDVRALAATCRSVRATLETSRGAFQFIWTDFVRRTFPQVFRRVDPSSLRKRPPGPVERRRLRTRDIQAELSRFRSGENGGDNVDCGDGCVEYRDVNLDCVAFLDDYNLTVPGLPDEAPAINLPLLTGLMPARYPGTVNLGKTRNQFRSFALAVTKNSFGSMVSVEDAVDETQMVVPVVQYCGRAVTGNRCIVSDRPFPPNCVMAPDCDCEGGLKISFGGRLPYWAKDRPHESAEHGATSLSPSLLPGMPHHSAPLSIALYTHGHMSALLHYDNNHESLGRNPNGALRPFVVPTVVSDNRKDQLVVDLTPKLVAYYEVTIVKQGGDSTGNSNRVNDARDRPGLPHHQAQQPAAEPEANDPRRMIPHLFIVPPGLPRDVAAFAPPEAEFRRAECVAVGLSTADFDGSYIMPGWDHHSWGYHGDDGRIFHGRGRMLRRYGPLFGPGDVVGCGLEYGYGRVFFTKNGVFLGYAFDGWEIGAERIERGLYPTVGVDTKCPIFVNFGERPFVFDLNAFAVVDVTAAI